MATRRAHGIDISVYQSDFDIDLVTANDLDFAILKATENNWTDNGYAKLVEATRGIPIRGAYHYYSTRTRKYAVIQDFNSTLEKQWTKSLKAPRKAKEAAESNLKKAEKALRKANQKNKNKAKANLAAAQQACETATRTFKRHNNKIGVLVGKKEEWIYSIQLKHKNKTAADWKTQADHFISQVSGKGLDFYALDLETGPNIDRFIGLSNNSFTSDDLEDIKKWLDYVAKETGKPVIIYTAPYIYGGVLRPKDKAKFLHNYKLWLAAYKLGGDKETTNPVAVTEKQYRLKRPENDWSIWQYSADGNEQGPKYGLPKSDSKIPDIDLNVYNGTLREMRAWLEGKDVTEIPPEKPDDQDQQENNQIETTDKKDAPKDPGGTQAPVVDPTQKEPTYTDLTNQKMLNLISDAANSGAWWNDWVVPAELQHLAASDEARLQPYTGPKVEDLPGLSEAQKQALSSLMPGAKPVEPKAPGFWVKINTDQTPIHNFTETDKKGKPTMKDVNPPLHLSKGMKVFVSSTFSVSDLDAGDGIVLAQRRIKYYRVIHAPSKPEAENNFIQKTNTLPTSAPGGASASETDSPGSEALIDPPGKKGFWVRTTKHNTACKRKVGEDGKGKPQFRSHKPPIRLERGSRIFVSSTHKESDIDKGDGIIFATGRVKHYLVLASPDNPDAVNTFVLEENTTPIK